ncbi:LLM class flavin-dependent oxidoreductase [Micromonospora craniellae]|uniref:LLM class flavin-dependent oxidoreductase n=1 Tax=Micromonospora craniellae TaxID=2294034 RepID=UPI0013145F91|nr:LLM class flavin-dependent oxidoreductase [Micromonospora craniellae]QOC93411.1 LLM class flavin-dependent oxidoreductase [Micromonospora craniellae]
MPELGRVAQKCEALGYTGVWFPDSQLLWRDPYLAAAQALLQTSSLTVGIAVSTVATRHVSVVAGLHRTLAELAPDRFRLGLGTGSSATGTVGLPQSRTAEVRAAVEAIRRLGAGESHDFGVGPVRQVGNVPISGLYLAATGPRNLALAGELADGVLMLNGADQAALQASLRAVEAGESRRPVGLRPLRRTVTSFCLPTVAPERDARRLKPLCVAMAQQLGGGSALASAGVRVSDEPPSRPVYPDLVHAEDWDSAVEAVDHLVSDEDALVFARRFCFFGGLDEIRQQLRSLRDCGISEVMLQHVGSFQIPFEWLEQCAELNDDARRG